MGLPAAAVVRDSRPDGWCVTGAGNGSEARDSGIESLLGLVSQGIESGEDVVGMVRGRVVVEERV